MEPTCGGSRTGRRKLEKSRLPPGERYREGGVGGAVGGGVGVGVGVMGGVSVKAGVADGSGKNGVGVDFRGMGGRSAPTLTTPRRPGTHRTATRIKTAAKTAHRRMSRG